MTGSAPPFATPGGVSRMVNAAAAAPSVHNTARSAPAVRDDSAPAHQPLPLRRPPAAHRGPGGAGPRRARGGRHAGPAEGPDGPARARHDRRGRGHARRRGALPRRARPLDGSWPPRRRAAHAGFRLGEGRHAEGAPSAAFEADPQLAALFTRGDGPLDWLRAGQAPQRVLLTATARGVAASLFSQPLDLRPAQHSGDRAGPLGHVQMLIGLGYGRPVPRVPRRPAFEVLDPVEAARR